MSTLFTFKPSAMAYAVTVAFYFAAREPRPAVEVPAEPQHAEAQVEHVTLVADAAEDSTATAKLKTFSAADMLAILGVSRVTFADGIANGRFPDCDLIAGKGGRRYWFEETVNEILAQMKAAVGPDATKPCRVCMEVKPLFDFTSQRQCNDGYSSVCKACTKASRDHRKLLKGEKPASSREEKAYEGVPAASRWETSFSLRKSDRPDGKLKAYTDIERRGIVHRGEVSSVIANYLSTTT
jgi:hypothetical protein